jgi:hypothetical protein
MIPLPIGIEAKDVSQWIHHGVFLYRPPGGELEPCTLHGWIPETQEDGVHLKVTSLRDNSKAWGPFILNAKRADGHSEQVFCHWPMCGSINMHDYKAAVYVQRMQKKQYTRTFTSSCVKLTIPDQKFSKISTGLGMLISGSREVVLELFEPKYFTFAEGMERGTYHDWGSFAINPHIIITMRRIPRVYFDGQFVGQIKEGYLETFDPSLKRRIVDAFDGQIA